MNLSEIIPIVVVFAMYTSAVVGAVWLVVLGDWKTNISEEQLLERNKKGKNENGSSTIRKANNLLSGRYHCRVALSGSGRQIFRQDCQVLPEGIDGVADAVNDCLCRECYSSYLD